MKGKQKNYREEKKRARKGSKEQSQIFFKLI